MRSLDSYSLNVFVAVLCETIQRNILCWALWIIPSTSYLEIRRPSLRTWLPSGSTGGLMLICCMISSIISSYFGASTIGVGVWEGVGSTFFSSFLTYFLPLFLGSLKNAASRSASSLAFLSISSSSSLFRSSSSSSITTNKLSAISPEVHSTRYLNP